MVILNNVERQSKPCLLIAHDPRRFNSFFFPVPINGEYQGHTELTAKAHACHVISIQRAPI